MSKIIVLFFSLLLAFPAYAVDGTKLLEQVDKNMSPESYESYRKIINLEPDGKKKGVYLFYRQKRDG